MISPALFNHRLDPIYNMKMSSSPEFEWRTRQQLK
jgi:hypothetical protein